MLSTPQISIVVPAYNEEKYLGPTLSAISAAVTEYVGAYPHDGVEIVVVDDVSTDRTADIAAAHGCRVVSGNHSGIGAARNLGAKSARGELLVFVDADTRVPPALLRRLVTAVDMGIRAGAVAPHYTSERIAIRALLALWRWYAPRFKVAQGVCQFFETSAFETLGGYDESKMMAEDTDLYRRAHREFPGAATMITDISVFPSTRRYDQWPTWKVVFYTNPLTSALALESKRLWRAWYANPVR